MGGFKFISKVVFVNHHDKHPCEKERPTYITGFTIYLASLFAAAIDKTARTLPWQGESRENLHQADSREPHEEETEGRRDWGGETEGSEGEVQSRQLHGYINLSNSPASIYYFPSSITHQHLYLSQIH